MSDFKREIKFRGKKVDDGEWVYGYYVRDTMIPASEAMCLGDCKIKNVIIKDGVMWHVIPETVGQYTGLKDKSGKEIYEGDKIKTFEISEYNNKMKEESRILYCASLDGLQDLTLLEFGDDFYTEPKDCNCGYHLGYISLGYDNDSLKTNPEVECEVIGNIHEVVN